MKFDKEEIFDVSSTPQGDEEETKGRKGLKVLTPNKLLTRLPLFLLAQIIAENKKTKNLQNNL